MAISLIFVKALHVFSARLTGMSVRMENLHPARPAGISAKSSEISARRVGWVGSPSYHMNTFYIFMRFYQEWRDLA